MGSRLGEVVRTLSWDKTESLLLNALFPGLRSDLVRASEVDDDMVGGIDGGKGLVFTACLRRSPFASIVVDFSLSRPCTNATCQFPSYSVIYLPHATTDSAKGWRVPPSDKAAGQIVLLARLHQRD